ncbi:MAG: hypothetical protein AB1422_02165 [bacterium]
MHNNFIAQYIYSITYLFCQEADREFFKNIGKRSGGVTKGDVEIKEIGRYY